MSDEHDTRQRNVPEGERMYAIGEGDLCCIKMFIEDNANHDDEILDIVRNALLHPLSEPCMDRNGAQGQQNDLLHEIRNLHAAAHDQMCKEDVDESHVTFWKGQWLAYNNVAGLVEHMVAQPQDAAGKADLIPILMYCRNIINTDKSGLAMALDRIRRVAKGYSWIPLNEWGSYEYTERTTTTLQKEVGFMLQEIDNIADLALKESGERVNVHIREIEKGVAELRTTPASPGKAGDVPASHGRKVITLCGSVKFWDEYKEWNARLTLEGNVVFSCGLSMKEGYEDLLCDLPLDDVKKDLDVIHLCKIDMSDEIFVLNVGGYIGESTKREIEYATSKGKRVRYLEKEAALRQVQQQ